VALFGSMTVLENVMLGAHCRSAGGFFANALRLPRVRREEAAIAAKADSILQLLGLERVAGVPVMQLPFGTRKRVELARALAVEPKLLLLDEPASGLNHEEVGELGGLIRGLRERLRLTVLLVEHHMSLVMSISERVVALNFGRVIAQGAPAEVRRHPELMRAYLGAA
jgi:branched-chain amino acid transport system ATP-binding protein